MTNFLENKRILLIVSGGIASYKSLDLIRRLQEKKVKVECILTESAKKFINPITFESLLDKGFEILIPMLIGSIILALPVWLTSFFLVKFLILSFKKRKV